MSVIYVVVPLALLFVIVGLILFFWATRRGQFDDLETPAHRALFEDQPVKGEPSEQEDRPRP